MEGMSQCYLAEALVASGELGLAEEAARRASELLGSARPTVAALAVATLARVQLLRGDAHEALETAEEAYALAASAPVEEGEASVLLVRAECLDACGHRERARDAIAEASRRLDERAAKIADPERRRTFLEGISDHARTRALVREWS